LAQEAERGKFDIFFVADTPAARTVNMNVWSKFPMFMNQPEPVTLLAAVAGFTNHIGLGATVSTSFFEPYDIARQFASLDHISHSRAAWNPRPSGPETSSEQPRVENRGLRFRHWRH
jgi:alkanesulfonate monooxygenase SsuD/methylene tetrahydromethanopterin reductase-like flavin-dependent oxidoreductase (luciferase family)